MFTNQRLNSKGFTLVEMCVGLALAALGILALMGTNDYFRKSHLAVETRSTHTNLRNHIYQALANRITVCPPGLPCEIKNSCPINLHALGGGNLSIPASALNTTAPITLANQVKLTITMGNTSTPLVDSATLGAPYTQRENQDHLEYEVLLTGNYKSQTSANLRTYVGAVELIGHRDIIGQKDELRAQIPIEFTVSTASGALVDCVARTTERTISGGLNTLDRCVDAGGVTVPSSLGNLCRFRSKLTLDELVPPCPPGFVGDSLVGCTVDTSTDSDFLDTIPPCPSVLAADGSTIAGVTDPAKHQGSYYCNYQGIAGGPAVGNCPDDPDWDPAEPPRIGWDDISSPAFTVTTNLRKCQYTFNCPPPNTQTVLAPPIGDGQTPTCSRVITSCPNTDPPTSPPPWNQTSSSPLTCKFSALATPPPPSAQCAPGFYPVDVAAHPEVAPWNDATTRVAHIVCY